MTETINEVHACAAEVARASYGRLLAILSSKTGDILSAEDALGDAFQRALQTWPEQGIPDKPEAWLFTTAHHRLIDTSRKKSHHQNNKHLDNIQNLYAKHEDEDQSFPDDRLKLLFICAHPAIDSKIHTPLMLQTVLGLDAQTIANAFLVSPASMAQRLVRAKRKIKDAAIPFIVPELSESSARLSAVLEAIYGAFSIDWMATTNTSECNQQLSAEALFLINILTNLLPHEPEVLGLAALISFSNARKSARVSHNDCLIPLDQQDTTLWDKKHIDKAENLLMQAHHHKQIGRFQLEAAIQSVHCNRIYSGITDWKALAQLYEGLQKIAPTIGAAVGKAAAMGEAYGAETGLACLDQIDDKTQISFQPAWATRAYLLSHLGKNDEALKSYNKAIGLSSDKIIVNFLTTARDMLRDKKI